MGIYYRISGKIVSVNENGIAIENNGIAYALTVARPFDFTLEKEASLFIHEVIAEDDHYLIGFSSLIEKDAFLSLLSVKGIGPKTALGALKATSPDALFSAIESNNTAYLKKLPGIGAKAAAQIILDLRGKLSPISDKKGDSEEYIEAKAALKILGFKSKDILDALGKIEKDGKTDEEIIRLALRQLGKGSK